MLTKLPIEGAFDNNGDLLSISIVNRILYCFDYFQTLPFGFGSPSINCLAFVVQITIPFKLIGTANYRIIVSSVHEDTNPIICQVIMIEIEIEKVRKGSIGKISVSPSGTIGDVKKEVSKINRKLYVDRQSVRTEARGKDVKDSTVLSSLNLQNGSKLYIKDLGPQVSWTTVFLCEYAGPLFAYGIFMLRPWFAYRTVDTTLSSTAEIAGYCWLAHYAKRLLETIFVHRFSHATMPILNIFKNCMYYWGFAAYVSYHVNHPLFTPPSETQFYIGLVSFILCELGNLSSHLMFRDLRPPGTKARNIPMPNGNPFTLMTNFVSCPNYTYEVGAWISFAIMTSCLPALFFAIAGLVQMGLWAINKHKTYLKEFPNYPRGRKCIIPFIL